jgi:hypothetical protein
VEGDSYYLEMFAAGQQVEPVEIHYSVCLTSDLFIHQVGKRINDSIVKRKEHIFVVRPIRKTSKKR